MGSANVRPLKASPSGGLRPALTGLVSWRLVWRSPDRRSAARPAASRRHSADRGGAPVRGGVPLAGQPISSTWRSPSIGEVAVADYWDERQCERRQR